MTRRKLTGQFFRAILDCAIADREGFFDANHRQDPGTERFLVALRALAAEFKQQGRISVTEDRIAIVANAFEFALLYEESYLDSLPKQDEQRLAVAVRIAAIRWKFRDLFGTEPHRYARPPAPKGAVALPVTGILAAKRAQRSKR